MISNDAEKKDWAGSLQLQGTRQPVSEHHSSSDRYFSTKSTNKILGLSFTIT
jgi:hypothetical protein